MSCSLLQLLPALWDVSAFRSEVPSGWNQMVDPASLKSFLVVLALCVGSLSSWMMKRCPMSFDAFGWMLLYTSVFILLLPASALESSINARVSVPLEPYSFFPVHNRTTGMSDRWDGGFGSQGTLFFFPPQFPLHHFDIGWFLFHQCIDVCVGFSLCFSVNCCLAFLSLRFISGLHPMSIPLRWRSQSLLFIVDKETRTYWWAFSTCCASIDLFFCTMQMIFISATRHLFLSQQGQLPFLYISSTLFFSLLANILSWYYFSNISKISLRH